MKKIEISEKTGGSCVLPSLWKRELGFWKLLFREVTICAVPFCLLSRDGAIWWNWTRTVLLSSSLLHLRESGVFRWWMTWEAWCDESISNCPFSLCTWTVLLLSLLWKKGTCLCLLASTWYAASRERWKESSWDSSCSVRACNSQASRETRMYISRQRVPILTF